MSIQALFTLADRLEGIDPMHLAARQSYEQSLQELNGLAEFVRETGSPAIASCLVAAAHAVKGLSAPDPHLDAVGAQRAASQLLRVVAEALTRREARSRVDPWPDARGHLGAERPNGAPGPAPPRVIAAERSRATPKDTLLGEILLKLGHVTPDQVQAALRLHRAKGMAIGECLLLSGACAPERVLEGLSLQQRLRAEQPRPAGKPAAPATPEVKAHFHVTTDIFLGEVLLGAEMITKEHLEAAMRMHHLKGVRVGDALLAVGALSPEELACGIELQRSLQSIALKTARPVAQST